MDSIGAPENLLIFGEEEEEQSASIHHVDSLSDASSDDDMSSAVDVSISRDLETSDVVSDDPDWYVEPVIPEALRSPMRTAAANCLTDSILTFNIDSVLTEATTYDYDAAGRTIRTTVWQYNADGSRTGKSKQEYAFDASGTQIYTGTFAWDAATNDWKGTSKSEYVYNEAHKMESNITYTWVNNTWLPSQALTYAYDAAGREIEFTTYTRNASANRLVPSKQRLQTWYNASKKTLEINYTAYSNGAWSAGNKKEYAYDAKGNQIEYTYYASYSGGNWVGSTHELWTYNASNKKTLYEKYTWSNGAWVTNTKEVFDYDAAGNNIFYEKYTGSNNQWKGSKKEDYTYNSAKKKIETITYKWTNSGWEYNTKTISPYDAYNNRIENTKYTWTNGFWKGTGTRTTTTYNSSKQILAQITYTWGVTDWVNATKLEYAYSGTKTTMEADYTWNNDMWVGGTKTEYFYNAAGQNDTTRSYVWGINDWVFDFRTVNTFDSYGNQILGHSSSWNGARWVMTAMTRTDISYDAAGRITLNANWHCGSDSIWVGENKVTYMYDDHGNTSLTSNYTWSFAANDWQLSAQSRYEAGYDAANHQILSASYVIDVLDMTWRGTDKYEYSYDSNNNQIYQAHFKWSGGNWVYDWKLEVVYNLQNKKILDLRATWTNGTWVGNYRYEYDYDNFGNRISEIQYKWNAANADWEGVTRNESAYDGNRKIMESAYGWNQQMWAWRGLYRYEYEFDVQGRLLCQVSKSYDMTNSAWVNSSKMEQEYNIRGLNNKTQNYTWLNNDWSLTSLTNTIYDDADNKIRRETIGSWSSGVVTSFTDKHYFYSCDAPADNNGAQPRTPTELEEIDENYDTNVQPFDPMLPTYNLQGQSVDPATYHGIVIQNGKKYVL